MKNRALLSALALCFIAAGCDSQKTAKPPEPKAAAVVPLPPPAPTAPAASSGQDAKPAQVAQADAKPDTKAGAAPMARPKKGCSGNNCKVEITVGANCAITVDPQNLPVFAQNVEIKWSLKPAHWKFAANGIDFKDTGQGQFHNPAGGNSNNFKWKDDNTDQRPYGYWIHVVNGKDKCDADPSIVNGAETDAPPPY